MKNNKHKKMGPGYSQITSNRLLCHLFLALLLPLLSANAQPASKQLDPVDFLIQKITEPPQKPNTPKAEKPPSKKIGLETINFTGSENIKTEQKLQETQNTGQDTVKFTAPVDKELPKDNLAISVIPNNLPKRRLWRAGINILKEHEDKENKTELQKLITQVGSFELKPEEQNTEAETKTELIAAPEPIEILPDTNTPQEPETVEIEPELAYGQLTNQTLQLLGNISQQSSQIANPFALGEILFHSGHLNEAAICYRQALEQNTTSEIDPAQNKAWILFQIGNCLRSDDMPNASKAYQQLITEYPDSLWTDLAKAQNKLIDWHQNDKPKKLISKHNQSNNSYED